jgi:hypothetical protein
MTKAPRTHAIAAATRRTVGALAVTLAAAGLAPAIGAAAVALPAGTLPAGTLPAGTLPAGTLPAGTLPAGTLPAGAPPTPAENALKQMHFGVRLVDVPVDEAHNPRALRYIIDFLPTGSVIHRRIMIINDEPRTAHFTVYPAAAQISNGMFIGAAGHARNELTGWITVQHPSVTIGPGGSAMDLVTIRVPRGATRAEHFGVIWAEQSQPVRSSPRVTVNVVARVGVRVYLAVGPGGVPPTSFAITSMTGQLPAPGKPTLTVGVRDTGGRAVDLDGRLLLSHGPGGISAGPFRDTHTVTLAPGQAGSLTFALPAALPAGPWTATVTLVSGQTTATARASVSFGARVAAASWASAATLAWGGGMLVGMVVIGSVLAVRFWRPRRWTT